MDLLQALSQCAPQTLAAAVARLPREHQVAIRRAILPAPRPRERMAIDPAELRRWLREGRSQQWMAKQLHTSQSTVSRAIAKLTKGAK